MIGRLLKLIGLVVVVLVAVVMCQSERQENVGSYRPSSVEPAVQTGCARNEAYERLQQLPEAERREQARRYLVASGEKCGGVTGTFHQGQTEEYQAIWNFECVGGKAFVVMIEPDAQGSTVVMDCALLKKMNAGTCYTKF